MTPWLCGYVILGLRRSHVVLVVEKVKEWKLPLSAHRCYGEEQRCQTVLLPGMEQLLVLQRMYYKARA